MSAIDTLTEIAELLPPKQREQFLLMCARFRNVPEDDEYLQMLEGIGFMTLLMREVPEQLSKVIHEASPVSANHQQIAALIHETISKAIPNYSDLQLITERLENHSLVLNRLLAEIKQQKQKRIHPGWWGLGFLAGFMSHELLTYALYRLSGS